jgi:hypothetical protein
MLASDTVNEFRVKFENRSVPVDRVPVETAADSRSSVYSAVVDKTFVLVEPERIETPSVSVLRTRFVLVAYSCGYILPFRVLKRKSSVEIISD